jgi:hypothetical protein
LECRGQPTTPAAGEPFSEVVKAADVAVERGGADAELLGDAGEGHRFQAFGVRERLGGAHDRLGVESGSRHQSCVGAFAGVAERPARAMASSIAGPGSRTAGPWPTTRRPGSSARRAAADSRSFALAQVAIAAKGSAERDGS